jgi:hypothetical protein
MIYHFTYQTKNLVNDKTYIGVHSTKNLNDGYLGSGDKLKKAILKYGKLNFKIEILCFFDSLKEAYEEESFIVDKKWTSKKDNYNVSIGGNRGPDTTGYKHTEYALLKIANSKKGNLNPTYKVIDLNEFRLDVISDKSIIYLKRKYKLSNGGVSSKLKEISGNRNITEARCILKI